MTITIAAPTIYERTSIKKKTVDSPKNPKIEAMHEAQVAVAKMEAITLVPVPTPEVPKEAFNFCLNI